MVHNSSVIRIFTAKQEICSKHFFLSFVGDGRNPKGFGAGNLTGQNHIQQIDADCRVTRQ
jgi:hypothetical protein